MAQTSIVDVKHTLTDEETNEMAHKLAEELRHFGIVSQEKKSVMSNFKSELDLIDKDIQEMANKIALGYFFEPTECTVEIDEYRRKKVYRETLSGLFNIVQEEDMDTGNKVSLFEGAEVDGEGILHPTHNDIKEIEDEINGNPDY